MKLGIPRNARIKDVIQGGEWRMRRCRDRNIRELVEELKQFPVILEQHVTDYVLWRDGSQDYRNSFSSKTTWEIITTQREVTDWWRVVWFQQGVPRFSLSLGLH